MERAFTTGVKEEPRQFCLIRNAFALLAVRNARWKRRNISLFPPFI